jgi:hypothetical protein
LFSRRGIDFSVPEDYLMPQEEGHMGKLAKSAWQIFLVALWINVSETVRWMLYSQSRFEALYQSRGLKLPSGPMNMALWMVWGFVIAYIVFVLARKFSLLHTTLLSWVAAFITTWIILWNFGILPIGILWVAVPLSLFEIFIAALISARLQGRGAA